MVSGSDKGFSLLELLVAIFILSVGLLATATVLVTGIDSNRLAQMVTVESGLAYSVLDELMARDESDPIFDTTQSNVTYDLDTDSGATTRTVQGVTYSATYSITANTPVVGVARIDVTVTGGGRTVTLTSFKRSI